MGSRSIFLDTNIVADMIDATRKNHAHSLALLKILIQDEYHIFISEDMLSTLYYISKDKQATLAFFQNVIYIDWEVVSYGKDILEEATQISMNKGADLEDTLQCLCAKKNACSLLVTNDKKFVRCGVEVVNYERFLK